MNLPNPIVQTKNLLLKINENVISKEEFDLEFEAFQFMNYYNKKEYIQKQIPAIVFNVVKMRKYLIWLKLKQRKHENDIMKIDYLK